MKRCHLNATLLSLAVTLLCGCGALDPIPLHELSIDAGSITADTSLPDLGEDAGDDAGVVDAGDDMDVDVGVPVETAIQRWFAEACAFSRRCEAKEPSARAFQQACVAPLALTLDQLLPPDIYARLQGAGFNQVLGADLTAYLLEGTALCDIAPFLEPDRIFDGAGAEGDICADDFACDSIHCGTSSLSCDARRCLPRRVTGDLCERDGTCPLGDYCQAGECTHIPAVGESCPAGRCALGATCNEVAVCVSRGDFGAPCSRNANGRDTCGAGLVCANEQGSPAGHCAAGRSVGDACDATHRPCANGLRCDGGACLAVGVTGARCIGDHQCVDGFACTSGTCTARPLLGQSCAVAPCLIGTCRSGTCQHPTAGFSCSRTSLLDPVPNCKDAYCDAGLCRTYLAIGDACEYDEPSCGPMGACGGNLCQARGTIGSPCGGPPLPPCLNDLTCVGPVGAQTCQACE